VSERDDANEVDVEGRIYKIEMRQAKFEKFKAAVEMIAIILAGIWGFYQFVYEDKIKPFQETPSLSVTVKLDKLGTHGPWQAIRATETIVNDSRIRVSILARAINLYGLNVAAKPKNGPFVLDNGSWNVNREYRLDNPIMLQSHAVLFSGDARSGNRRWWLQPGDTATQSAIYFVKIAQYDVIRFDANYQFTKYDLVPPFVAGVLSNGSRALVPANQCADLEESSHCPVSSVNANSAMSLW
jgi:hypothetical protein